MAEDNKRFEYVGNLVAILVALLVAGVSIYLFQTLDDDRSRAVLRVTLVLSLALIGVSLIQPPLSGLIEARFDSKPIALTVYGGTSILLILLLSGLLAGFEWFLPDRYGLGFELCAGEARPTVDGRAEVGDQSLRFTGGRFTLANLSGPRPLSTEVRLSEMPGYQDARVKVALRPLDTRVCVPVEPKSTYDLRVLVRVTGHPTRRPAQGRVQLELPSGKRLLDQIDRDGRALLRKLPPETEGRRLPLFVDELQGYRQVRIEKPHTLGPGRTVELEVEAM